MFNKQFIVGIFLWCRDTLVENYYYKTWSSTGLQIVIYNKKLRNSILFNIESAKFIKTSK